MNSETAARILAADPDYRVLRRIPPLEAWPFTRATGPLKRALFLDVETTGLEERDEVIELALLPFAYERDTGRIVEVFAAEAYAGLREPSIPIPPESARVHGLTDQDIAGHVIDEDRVRALVTSADLIIAHNASFDRPMVEKHWPIFEMSNFACSLQDIGWSDEGLKAPTKLRAARSDRGTEFRIRHRLDTAYRYLQTSACGTQKPIARASHCPHSPAWMTSCVPGGHWPVKWAQPSSVVWKHEASSPPCEPTHVKLVSVTLYQLMDPPILHSAV